MTSSCIPRNGPETRTMALSQPARLFLLPPRGQSSVGSTGRCPKTHVSSRGLDPDSASSCPRKSQVLCLPQQRAGVGEDAVFELCTWRAQL